MFKPLLITLTLLSSTAFAASIECSYVLDSKDEVRIVLTPWKDTPSGSHIKTLDLYIGSDQHTFKGKDFNLATMKWDDLGKWYLGALIQTENHKFNFIHVGPGEVEGQYSILDFGTVISGVPGGRYEPMGSCHLK